MMNKTLLSMTGYATIDWPQWMGAALLVLMRLSGFVAFAPIFSSGAIAPRIKAGFVIAMAFLLTPAIAVIPGSHSVIDATSIFGELSVGLIFGLSLKLLTEMLAFTGMLLGMQFSFSLVNLLDPNSMVETPVLGQLLNWVGILILIAAGLDRTLLAALLHSFATVAVGTAVLRSHTAMDLIAMASGIFFAGLQLAAPVVSAGLVIEITVALVSRLAPQLPAMIISIPIKALISYIVLIGSLALWPLWIERHFVALLRAAERMVALP